MTLHEFAELTSLGLTVPTLVLCSLVVVYWHKDAIEALKTRNRDATQWFIMGVAIGFLGSIIDNAYWGVAWSANYLEHPAAGWLFSNGVWPNIFFRQGAGILAAYCHVRAAAESTEIKKRKWLNKVITMSFVGGVAFTSTLMVIKTLSLDW